MVLTLLYFYKFKVWKNILCTCIIANHHFSKPGPKFHSFPIIFSLDWVSHVYHEVGPNSNIVNKKKKWHHKAGLGCKIYKYVSTVLIVGMAISQTVYVHQWSISLSTPRTGSNLLKKGQTYTHTYLICMQKFT